MSDEHQQQDHQCRCEEANEEALYPKLAEIIAENSNKPENLIMVLHKAQNLFGYLPKKLLQAVAEGLGLSLSQVHGVVSFYSFFSTAPKGRNSVKVCLGTACYVRGGQQTLTKVQHELDINVGGTTEDRKYSLDVVRCIGACGLAPAILVNDDVYGRVKTTKLMEILERYK
jgi:NADH:ubiquinone oxidoreductase subunit E